MRGTERMIVRAGVGGQGGNPSGVRPPNTFHFARVLMPRIYAVYGYSF